MVELLTHLDLDTGFNVNDLECMKHPISNAGLESDIRDRSCPFITKSPWFCDFASEIVHREDVKIQHIFIPIRNLYDAAESRRRVSQNDITYGGLWHTDSYDVGKQEEVLLCQIYKLIYSISDTMIPVTLMRYPRLVRDCPYLYEKLKPILQDIPYDFFREKFRRVASPELVHKYHR